MVSGTWYSDENLIPVTGNWRYYLKIFRCLYRRCPPLPIPNREVKPARADGTAVTRGRVGRCLSLNAPFRNVGGFFCGQNFCSAHSSWTQEHPAFKREAPVSPGSLNIRACLNNSSAWCYLKFPKH